MQFPLSNNRETHCNCPEKLWLPLPGSVQGQLGWGFEHCGLVEGVSAHGRMLE